MPSIVIGNTAPIEAIKPDPATDEVVRNPRPDLGNTTTVFAPSDHLKLGQVLTLVSSVYASHHSDEPPAWIESDDEDLAKALAAEFGCPVGRPDGWEEGVAKKTTETKDVTDQPSSVSDDVEVSAHDVAPLSSILSS